MSHRRRGQLSLAEGLVARRALGARLFAAVTAPLTQRGLVLKRGALIDATLVAAAVAAPPPRYPAPQATPLRPARLLSLNLARASYAKVSTGERDQRKTTCRIVL